jgi:hypothetical protein
MIPVSLSARIWPFQGRGPGSIPGRGTNFFIFFGYLKADRESQGWAQYTGNNIAKKKLSNQLLAMVKLSRE